MAGEAVVGDRRIGRRCGRHRPEVVEAGHRSGHERATCPVEGGDVAQVVGPSVVEGARGRAHFRLHGDDPPAQPVGGADGVGRAACYCHDRTGIE